MKKTIVMLLVLIASEFVTAQVPGTLSYQGILMQSDGITPIADGAHSIVFSFYTVPSAGSALFTRTISVTTAKGLYTCIIGGGTAPNAPLNATEMNQVGSQQVYIGINVDGGGELSPRAQLTTNPYSFRAESITNTANPTGGNVTFWGTNNTLGSDAELFWDNTNKRLGVGIAAPLNKLHVRQTLTGTAITTPVLARFQNNTINGHTKVVLGTDNATADGFSTFSAGATSASLILGFGVGNAASTTTQLNLNGLGNVGIGTTSPNYKLEVNGNIVNSNPSAGYLGLTGDLPGYSAGIYPTLKTSASYLYFSTGGMYTGFIGGTTDGTFGLNNSSAVAKVSLNAIGDSYLTGGDVGIGTTNPEAPLHVTFSSGTYGLVSRAFFTQSSGPSLIQDFTTTSLVSIRADGNILAASGAFIATSDKRIKEIIAKTDNKKDLDDLLQIEITDYKFIDKINNGDRLHKKVIAQQVQSVFPAAVNTTEGFIPNVFEVAGKVRVEESTTHIFTTKPHQFSNSDEVKLMLEQQGEKIFKVRVVDANEFIVDEMLHEKVFVYGKKVNDLLTVDYDALAALNISATQELKREIDAQRAAALADGEAVEKKLLDQQAQIEKLKSGMSEVNQLKEELAALTKLLTVTTGTKVSSGSK